MNDSTGLAEALLGLPGFRVLEVTETDVELVVTIETTATLVGCEGCGVRAEAQDRVPVDVRDLACFGRPARLRWIKRRWRCSEPLCDRRTWTERSEHLDAQVVLTRHAGAEAMFAAAHLGDEVIGVGQIVFERGWGGVQCMATSLAHRRRGVASAVLRALAEEAQRRDITQLYLAVMAGNDGAQALYERAGFRPAHEYSYFTDQPT